MTIIVERAENKMKKSFLILIPNFAIILFSCIALIMLSATTLPWAYTCETEGVISEIVFSGETYEARTVQSNGEVKEIVGTAVVENGKLTLSAGGGLASQSFSMPSVFQINGSSYVWVCNAGIAFFIMALLILAAGIVSFVIMLVYCIKHERDG